MQRATPGNGGGANCSEGPTNSALRDAIRRIRPAEAGCFGLDPIPRGWHGRCSLADVMTRVKALATAGWR